MNFKYTFIIFLLASVIAFAQEKDKLFTEAMSAVEKGFYQQSSILLEEYLRTNSYDDEKKSAAHFYLAEAYSFLGNSEAALGQYELIIRQLKFTQYRMRSLYSAGTIYFSKNNFVSARERLAKLNDDYILNEFFGSAQYLIGESFANENTLDSAIHYYEQAITNRNTNKFLDYTIYSLAYTFERLAKYSEAVSYYDELLSFHRESKLASSAQIRIGICYFKLKEYDSAILELLNPLVNTLPNELQAEAIYLLANAYYLVGEFENASKTYLEIITRFPSIGINSLVKYSLGWSYFQQKKYNDAYKIFNSITEGDDSLIVKAFYWKGEAKRYAGNDDDALKVYFDFLKKFPTNEYVKGVELQIGITFYNQKKFEQAIPYLLRATGSTDKHHRNKAFTLLGEIELNRKNFKQSKKYFDALEDESYTSGDAEFRALLGRGITDFYEKKYDSAVERLLDIDFRAPNFEHEKVSFYLAESYFYKSDFSTALKFYAKIDNNHPELGGLALYGRAISYFNLHDYKNSIYQLQDFLKKFPSDKKVNEIKIRLADSYFAEKKYEDAIKIYENLLSTKGISDKPDYVHYQYALCLFRANKNNLAIQEFERIVVRYPRSAYAENSIYLSGWIYFQNSDFTNAIAKYRYLLGFTRNQKLLPLAYYSIGDAYFNLGLYDSAIVNYKSILNGYPHSSYVFDALNGIQYSYVALGNMDEAVATIDDFVKRNPSATFADELFLKKGELYYSLRDYKNAKLSYKDFVGTFPKSEMIPQAYYWIGKSALNLAETEEAIYNFKIVFNNYLNDDIAPSAVIELCTILNLQKKYEESISIYLKAIGVLKNSSRLPELKYMLGETYLLSGSVPKAYDIFDEVIIYHDKNIFADKSRIELGIIEMNAKRFDNALKHFNDLTSKRTDDIGAQAQYYQGMAYLLQGKNQDAITSFVRVTNLFSNYDEWVAKSYLELGVVYEKIGDKEKAKEMYRIVLTKFRDDDFGKEAQKRLKKIK